MMKLFVLVEVLFCRADGRESQGRRVLHVEQMGDSSDYEVLVIRRV